MRYAILVLLGTLGAVAAGAFAAEIDDKIEAVNQAKDPSAAIAAFAGGMAVDDTSVELHAAYVRKMADLGMPNTAADQAKRLVELDPEHALGWSVVALTQSQETETLDEAVKTMLKAVELGGDDPFVQNAAGQLLAWYDSQPERTGTPEEILVAAVQIREKAGETEGFKEGYKTVTEALAQAEAGQAEEAAPEEQAVEAKRPVYRTYYYGPPSYSYYEPYPYDYYPYYYPRTSVIIVPSLRSRFFHNDCFVPIHKFHRRHDRFRHDGFRVGAGVFFRNDFDHRRRVDGVSVRIGDGVRVRSSFRTDSSGPGPGRVRGFEDRRGRTGLDQRNLRRIDSGRSSRGGGELRIEESRRGGGGRGGDRGGRGGRGGGGGRGRG